MASRYSLGEITTTVRYLEPIKWGELTLFVFFWFRRIIFDLTSARYPYCVFPFPLLNYAANPEDTDGRLQRDHLPTIKGLPCKSFSLIAHMCASANFITFSEH